MHIKKIIAPFALIATLASCKKQVDNTVTNSEDTTASDLASTFKGVNWADSRDNFADDALILSGTSTGDNYATIQTKSNTILTAFQNAGANTVRIPVNPPTVLQSTWFSYKGAIDKASSKGMKVLLGYWESASSKDGLVDDLSSFWQMWDAIVSAYQSDSHIYFEVFNEPHGYSVTDLENLYAQWLSRYPNLPKNRIVLDGAGYSSDITSIGSDSRFTSCLLSFHDYTWFENSRQTTADWEIPVKTLAYPDRTIVTEFGTCMIDGTNYSGAPASNVNNTYLQGITNSLHDVGMGSIYWPGLRTGDSFSMFSFNGTSMTVNNSTGLKRLQYAWNQTSVTQPTGTFNTNSYYKIVNRNSNKSLDVNGQSTADGAGIIQWDYWGGDNQQWKLNSLDSGYFSVINRNSNKALEVNGQSTSAGAAIDQWNAKTGNNQIWQVFDIGFGYYKIINKNSNLLLDVNAASTANGGAIIQWNLNNGTNQQWQITAL